MDNQLEEIAARYGGVVETDTETGEQRVVVNNTDAEFLRDLAADVSSTLGVTVTAEKIATDSFLSNFYATMPPGTIDTLLQSKPVVSQEMVAKLSQDIINQGIDAASIAKNTTLSATAEGRAIQEWAKANPNTLATNQGLQAYFDQLRGFISPQLQEQATAEFYGKIASSIKRHMDESGVALPTDLVANLIKDAGVRDPVAALKFLESYNNPALEQTMLPFLMSEALAGQGTLGRMGLSRRQPAVQKEEQQSQQELMKWLQEGENLQSAKDLIRETWTGAGANLKLERNPLGEVITPASERYWQQKNAYEWNLKQKLPTAFGVAATPEGQGLFGAEYYKNREQWTPEQAQEHTDLVERYYRAFGPTTDVSARDPRLLAEQAAQAAARKQQTEAVVAEQDWTKMTRRLGVGPRQVSRPVRGVYR